MAHTVLSFTGGRGSITVDGLRIPRVNHVTIDAPDGEVPTVTITVLADEVQVEVEADVVTIAAQQAEYEGLRRKQAELQRDIRVIAESVGEAFRLGLHAEMAKHLGGLDHQQIARAVERGKQMLKPGGGEHTWVEGTTIGHASQGQTAEMCTRCDAQRITDHGFEPDPMGTCPGRHPDDHTT